MKGPKKTNLDQENAEYHIDPAQIQAVKKIAVMKSVPYQTLIRHWLSECIRKELRIKS